MCCRYYCDPMMAEKALEDLEIRYTLGMPVPGGDITPGREALMITENADRLQASVAAWGFPGKERKLVINARSETASEKAMFRTALETRRCLFPAEGFYEWDRNRNKVTFTVPDQPVFFLAGLWNICDGTVRFVVLTTAANASMRPVHDRMPVIISSSAARPWLSDLSFALDYMKLAMPSLLAQKEAEQMRLFE